MVYNLAFDEGDVALVPCLLVLDRLLVLAEYPDARLLLLGNIKQNDDNRLSFEPTEHREIEMPHQTLASLRFDMGVCALRFRDTYRHFRTNP